MQLVKTPRRPLAFEPHLAYTEEVVIPAYFVALLPESEPALPPCETTAAPADGLKAQAEGIESGTNVSPPTEFQGGKQIPAAASMLAGVEGGLQRCH